MVPAVATFAVDDGFAYAVPDDLAERIAVGSVVRVPLGGRRVRGYVTALRDGDSRNLKPVQAISGDRPVFDARLLETLRWASLHYVAPLATLLAKAAPPNLPRPIPPVEYQPVAAPPAPALARQIATGARTADAVVIGRHHPADVGLLVSAAVAAERSALVVVASAVEAQAMAATLRSVAGARVRLGGAATSSRETTDAWWAAAQYPGTVVVGTRDVATWPIPVLGVAVIVDDGRRGMKERATPTMHVRDVLRTRGAVERFPVVTLASVPTLETLAAGPEVIEVGGRAWGLVELVDRHEEPPGGGLLAERTRRALGAVIGSGGRVFIFARRRGYAPAFRCVSCGELRRCRHCGAAASRQEACARCGEALGRCAHCGGKRFEPLGAAVGRLVDAVGRVVGSDAVAEAGGEAPALVGTERDLLSAGPVDLVVVVDADSLVLAPSYRAAEDALRLLGRVASLVAGGRGRRAMVQTAMADHPVYEALRRGRAGPFLEQELERRSSQGFPPAGEIIAVAVTGAPEGADQALRDAVGDGDVLGPAQRNGGQRWLIQGRDLRKDRVRLRPLVSRWREAGATVRVDADPIDL